MRVDYGYFEGDHLGKPYDISLMRRLFTYAKPYRLIIGVSIVLILFVTGFELLFPYLIKVAIDDYIVVSARKVTLSSRSSPLQKMLLDRYSTLLLPSAYPKTFFIRASDLKEIEPRDLASFQKADLIREEWFIPSVRGEKGKKGWSSNIGPPSHRAGNTISYRTGT